MWIVCEISGKSFQRNSDSLKLVRCQINCEAAENCFRKHQTGKNLLNIYLNYKIETNE